MGSSQLKNPYEVEKGGQYLKTEPTLSRTVGTSLPFFNKADGAN